MADNNRLKVHYESLVALYTDQAIVNRNGDSILMDLSSGVVQDPASGQPMVPVHTRIAMTPESAKRIVSLLQRALGEEESTAKVAVSSGKPKNDE